MKTKLLKKLRNRAKETYYIYFKDGKYLIFFNPISECVIKEFDRGEEQDAIDYLMGLRRTYIYDEVRKKKRRKKNLSEEDKINKRLKDI